MEDSFICEDCASVNAKELEVECLVAKEYEVECHGAKEHEVESDNAEVEDFGNVRELQPSLGFRGDPCIVSYGDAIDEDLCYDESTQLEHCDDEFLWDGNHDFTSYEEELEVDVDFICEVETCPGAEVDFYETCFDVELEDCHDEYHDAEVEACYFHDVEELEVECFNAEEETCSYDDEQDSNAEEY